MTHPTVRIAITATSIPARESMVKGIAAFLRALEISHVQGHDGFIVTVGSEEQLALATGMTTREVTGRK